MWCVWGPLFLQSLSWTLSLAYPWSSWWVMSNHFLNNHLANVNCKDGAHNGPDGQITLNDCLGW
jgi:hypothetical protein